MRLSELPQIWRWLIVAAPIAIIVLTVARSWEPIGEDGRAPHIPRDESEGERRVVKAREVRGDRMRELCLRAGLGYPPREIFLRAFKHEAGLEAWVRSDTGPFQLLKTWTITKSSGQPGPKRREGDLQVPEGFYTIDRFNPASLFHLSLGLNYPNDSDQILSDREQPGSDIFIHGGNASIGCLPIGDEGIEELFLLASDVSQQRRESPIQVHIFPARMSGPLWEKFAREQIEQKPELEVFWQGIQPGFEAFERSRRVPRITVEPDGAYRIEENAP